MSVSRPPATPPAPGTPGNAGGPKDPGPALERPIRAAGPGVPRFNPTVARITLRGVLGRRRALALLPLPALLVLVMIPVSGSSNADRWTVNILGTLGVGVILPLVALMLATSVLGSEIEDGSAVQLLAKPLPRRDIVLTKLLVAFAVTALFTAVPVYLAGMVGTASAGGLALGFALGTVAGAAVYCAIFLALSLVSRRAVAAGLGYVLLWEGALAGLLSGTRVFSVRQYVLSYADAVAGSPALVAKLSLPVAAVMGVLVLVLATALAVNRLRSFSLKGEQV
jgi:ABC-2 type transport system permease protein